MDDRDDVLDSVIAQLKPLPTVNADAKARLLIAVAAERERDRQSVVDHAPWQRRARWIGAASLLAAGLAAAVYLRSQPDSPVAATAVVTPSTATAPTPVTSQLAANDPAALEMAPQPVQFVFRAPAAATVRVVGDFNTWDKTQAPMVRDSSSGLWSVTLLIKPGRHVYAFVVDDSIWGRDPRAVAAADADFGRPGSVLLVATPRVQGIR